MNKSLHMDPHASRLVGPVTAIWKRGHNIACVSQRLQKAVDKVEVWANNWSFRLSVSKTQVICITKGKRVPSVKLKLYKQELEQVSV